jgi:hypothetical protein
MEEMVVTNQTRESNSDVLTGIVFALGAIRHRPPNHHPPPLVPNSRLSNCKVPIEVRNIVIIPAISDA